VAGALAYLGTSAGADASLAPALISFVAGRPAWLCQRPSPGYRPGRWWARHQAGLHRIPPWLMTGLNRVDSGADDQQG